MTAKQTLENYLLAHPDYWEFENELAEVERLKSLCQQEKHIQSYCSTIQPENRLSELVY